MIVMEKHAYLIAAHHQTELLRILVELLDDSENDIYLHIDKKFKNFKEEDILSVVKKSKLTFIKRKNISWGGFSQIQMEIDLLKEAVKTHHEYYHLISGVDLPIKSPKEIKEFFHKNKGKEFVSFDKIEEVDLNYRIGQFRLLQDVYGNKKNILFKFDALSTRIQKMLGIKRNIFKKYKLKKGSNWFSITHKLAISLVKSEKELKKSYTFSRCCDEVFLQTYIYNSNFKDSIYYDEDKKSSNMRLIDFKRGNPYIFKMEDYDELINSSKLFARKFDYIKDKEIILKIRKYVLERK